MGIAQVVRSVVVPGRRHQRWDLPVGDARSSHPLNEPVGKAVAEAIEAQVAVVAVGGEGEQLPVRGGR